MVFLVSNIHAALSLAVIEIGLATQSLEKSEPNQQIQTWSPENLSKDRVTSETTNIAKTAFIDSRHNKGPAKTLRNPQHVASNAKESHNSLDFDASEELGVLAKSDSRALQEEPLIVDDECNGNRPVIELGLRFESNMTMTIDGVEYEPKRQFHTLVHDCIYGNDGCPYTVPLGCWNTSKITDMRQAFSRIYDFNQPEGFVWDQGIASWDTSSVTDMAFLFSRAEAFNVPLDSWNTSSVTDMSNMFSQAEMFNQPIGSWDTSSVQDMDSMFQSAFLFNQPIDSWNVSKVTKAVEMFRNAYAFNQPLGSWDVSSIDMQLFDLSRLMLNAKSFNQCLSEWSLKLPLRVHGYAMFTETSCPYQLDSRDCDTTDCKSITLGPWCQGPSQQCYNLKSASSTWRAHWIPFFASVATVPTFALFLA